MEENNNRYRGPRRIGIENENARNSGQQENKKHYGRRLVNPYENENIQEPVKNPSEDLSRPRHMRNPYLEDIQIGKEPELIIERFHKAPRDDFYDDGVEEYDAEQTFYEDTIPFDEAYSNNDPRPDGSLERPYRVQRSLREEKDDEIEPLDDDLITYDEFGRKRKKKRIKEEKLVTKSRIVWGWIFSILAAIIIALLVRSFLFEIIMVDGDSMVPTLQNDEKLAVEKVSRYFGLPERGDIIIVHYPNMEGTYVKRVMGLPGDTIEIKDSTVYVNGQPLTESYINNTEPYMDMEAVTVPEDTVFVMGDNRAHSLDSRTNYIGPIATDQIVGHAMSVIWPLDKIHSVQ